jgi:cell division protein FtsZ
MGTGVCSEEDNRSVIAAERAISNPLLDRISISGASKVLINITGGMDMTLFEVDAAANRIRDEINNPNANIIFGSTFKQELEGSIVVSVFATGLEDKSQQQNIMLKPPISKLEEPVPEQPKPVALFQPKQLEIQNIIRPNVSQVDSSGDIYEIPAFLRKKNSNN